MQQGKTRKIREIRGWNEWTKMYTDGLGWYVVRKNRKAQRWRFLARLLFNY